VAACNAGLPFDAAFACPDDFVLAWLIAKGESEGREFNWSQMRWLEK
jgi:hypothetical protein